MQVVVRVWAQSVLMAVLGRAWRGCDRLGRRPRTGARQLRSGVRIEQMAPRDAQMYWMSGKIPNDQFLLFCFDSPHTDMAPVCEVIAQRAARIPDLRVRAMDVPGHLDYPYWVQRDETLLPVTVHSPHSSPGFSWAQCTTAVAGLLPTVLDVRECPWRLHLFPGVHDAPLASSGSALVAVLQMSHALSDGRRASAAARALFGGAMPVNGPVLLRPTLPVVRGLAVLPRRLGELVVASRRGYVAYRRQQQLVAAGEMDPQPQGFALTPLNADPGKRREIRMIVVPRAKLQSEGATVTVTVLTAISSALSRYLLDRGCPVPERLGAEVTVATGESAARNNFRNVGVDLSWSESDLMCRARRIADALQRRRVRAEHPVMAAQRAGGATLPAPLMWVGVKAFDPAAIPPTVAGNTVVSSVARGAADLQLADGQVLFTAGFPALSPVMGLTHGVHGIGDTVTVSVHASPDLMPDVDHYEGLLSEALCEVLTAQQGA